MAIDAVDLDMLSLGSTLVGNQCIVNGYAELVFFQAG